ncbi:hypothetical protein GFPCMMHI_05774 [Ensifer adhaerens]|nr:hypothetical protein [Ensifer adhaerens]
MLSDDFLSRGELGYFVVPNRYTTRRELTVNLLLRPFPMFKVFALGLSFMLPYSIRPLSDLVIAIADVGRLRSFNIPTSCRVD